MSQGLSASLNQVSTTSKQALVTMDTLLTYVFMHFTHYTPKATGWTFFWLTWFREVLYKHTVLCKLAMC